MIANAVTAFLDDRVGTGDGGSPAVVTADTTTTYAEVLALATRAGQGLRALGVEPEQRVAVLLPDGLLALHLGHDGRGQGRRAPASRPSRRPAVWLRRPRRQRDRPGLRHVEAVLRLRARQRAAHPVLRRRADLPELGLGRAQRRRRDRRQLPSDAPLLGADVLWTVAPSRAAERRVRLRAVCGVGWRAAACRDWLGGSRAGLARDPGRRGGHRDDLHGGVEPAGPKPGGSIGVFRDRGGWAAAASGRTGGSRT